MGATGGDEIVPILLGGLERLEYRGYDSAGIALQAHGELWRARAASGTHSLEHLRKVVDDAPTAVSAGIGHTRWATHGHPTEDNAHPHFDCSGTIAVVHNGIIENWRELAEGLRSEGHSLTSETDTEVIAHLVEDALVDEGSLVEAVRATLRRVCGAFALAVVSAAEPATIVAARRVSPLVIGVTDPDGFPLQTTSAPTTGPRTGTGTRNTALLASDVPALLGRAERFWVIDDDQVAELRPESIRVTNLAGDEVQPSELTVEWVLDATEKGGYDDFMSKELHEQPRAIADTLLGRLSADGSLCLDEMRIADDDLRQVTKVFIVACGSSYHAGLVGKYAIEQCALLPVEVDFASEFRYRQPVLDHRTLVICISQSGETTDTFQALRESRRRHAKVLVVSNVVDSSMARDADGVLYTRAGPEVGVAATKTHTAQIAALELIALTLAGLRQTMLPVDVRRMYAELAEVPDLVAQALDRSDAVAAVAAHLTSARDFFFLGRQVGYPVALEGALKLKEISYLRAEGYPAGELKHGPIALIELGTVVVAVATRTPLWEKMMSNVSEVQSRGATVVLVANDGDTETAAQADYVLWVPATDPLFASMVDIVPLQLLAYHLARAAGRDVDRPRNLAKTVTVE